MKGMIIMPREPKVKQIVIRFDQKSHDKIYAYAEIEHRSLGEFVRHAALHYIEQLDIAKEASKKARGGNQT
jgi:predicted HicB family RNase H-like nuclease